MQTTLTQQQYKTAAKQQNKLPFNRSIFKVSIENQSFMNNDPSLSQSKPTAKRDAQYEKYITHINKQQIQKEVSYYELKDFSYEGTSGTNSQSNEYSNQTNPSIKDETEDNTQTTNSFS